MKYIVTVLLLFLYNDCTGQTYTFNALVDNNFSNPDNWDPEYNGMYGFVHSGTKLVINAYCEAFEHNIQNNGRIEISSGVILTSGAFDSYGILINRGELWLSNYHELQYLVSNFGYLWIDFGVFKDATFYNTGSTYGEVRLENSEMEISKGEYTNTDQLSNYRPNMRHIYQQDSLSTMTFLLKDSENHTGIYFDATTSVRGLLKLQEPYSASGLHLPQACGLYEIIGLNTNYVHNFEFDDVKFFQNNNGFVTEKPMSTNQIIIKEFDDAIEMVTFYPETNHYIGSDGIWDNAANWSTSKVPSVCTDVVIPNDSSVVLPSNQKIKVNTILIGENSTLNLGTGSEVILYNMSSF